MSAPLLVFRIRTISKDAQWDRSCNIPLPEGCAAIAVSGGMEDLWERRKGKLSFQDGSGDPYLLPPFLSSSPSWVLPRIVWALLGPLARFYPIYRTSNYALKLQGVDQSILPDAEFDVLASLGFRSLQQAQQMSWSGGFLTCFSEGIGLGFSEGITKLERKLMQAESVVPFRPIAESKPEPIGQRMEDSHPYLFANWQENGFEWLIQNTSLVVRPWGWEGADAIFLSSKMSCDTMIHSIRQSLGKELQFEEQGEDEDYRKWSSWHWPEVMRSALAELENSAVD